MVPQANMRVQKGAAGGSDGEFDWDGQQGKWVQSMAAAGDLAYADKTFATTLSAHYGTTSHQLPSPLPVALMPLSC